MAIIPARGGSKGIPNKNLVLFDGKPLIVHTIEAALHARSIARVVVSTDSDDIARVATSAGAEVLHRPAGLASDTAPMSGVIRHAIEELAPAPEIVVVLQPTSPLRTVADIDGAIALAEASGAPEVNSVSHDDGIELLFRQAPDGTLTRVIPGPPATRRQDAQRAVRLNGAVFVVRRDTFLRTGLFTTDQTVGYLMGPTGSIDINTELDLATAEAWLASSRVTAATTRFGPFTLGAGAPLLVVAEIGVNHNGDRDLGLRQVRAAIGAGARAVKFQSFHAEELASRSAPRAEYQKRGETGMQLEMLRGLELSAADLAAYRAEAKRLGAIAFSTPFDPRSADELARAGVELMKLPSGEITNLELVAAVGATGLPTLMSTGMSTIDEVDRAVEAYRRADGGPLVLLHCVSSYPAPLEQQNLLAIPALRERFRVPIGLSDHTVGRDAAVAAVALGADVIEKHFTIDRTLPGPDHSMSMEPAEFAQMLDVLTRVRRGLGTGVKAAAESELEVRTVSRRSIVVTRDLPKGTVLARGDLAVKRPGDGLSPARLPELVGRRLVRDVRAEEQLRVEDVSP